MLVEISTPDAETYWEVSDKQLSIIVQLKMDSAKAADYIWKNCKKASIHDTLEVELGFATNCDKWEWDEFIGEIEEHLKG